MKTIQDYIQDAKNKVKIGLNAEHDYCVNKDKVRGTMCRAYAEASYKSARTAVKRAFALVGLTLPKKGNDNPHARYLPSSAHCEVRSFHQ